jgi:hypothetical protein
MNEAHERSHHRFTGLLGVSCATVLTAYTALSSVTGLSCHRRFSGYPAKLDTSVGVSGPHDFAVRSSAIRLLTLLASIASNPASVTIAKRPFVGWTAGVLKMFLPIGKAGYFQGRGSQEIRRAALKI